MSKRGKLSKPEDYSSGLDMIQGSDFLNELNKPKSTEPLESELNFYGISSTRKGRLVIPGKDDGVVPLKSAIPTELMKENAFGNVLYGEIVAYRTPEGHSSYLYNRYITEDILNNIDQSINFAIKKKVNCFVITGDFYHKSDHFQYLENY